MKWRDPTAQVGLHEMPADGTSPASEAQTGCRLRQTYKDDLWLSISAPYPRTRIERIIRDFQLTEKTFKTADRKGFQRNYLG